MAAQLAQYGGGLFHRCAGGHIHNHLELGLVVQRQHLQQHQTGGRQGNRNDNQHQHAQTQKAAIALAAVLVQQGLEDTLEQWPEFARQAGRRVHVGIGGNVFLHPQARQPGRDHEGNRQRQQHAHAGVDRDRAHVGTHQTRDKGHGQQRSDDGKSSEDGRAADFIDRARDDLGQGFARMVLLMPVDVLHHHDGVIDQNADRENQRKERNPVQREAPSP